MPELALTPGENMHAKFPSPLFAYIDSDAGGSVFIQVNEDFFLPLFTSLENAWWYADRADLTIDVVTLETMEEIAEFASEPPGVEVLMGDSFRIAMDPIAPDIQELLVVEKNDFVGYFRDR